MAYDDPKEPGTPAWWLRRLHPQVAVANGVRPRWSRLKRLDTLWAYRTGEATPPGMKRAQAEAVRSFQRLARANYAELITASMLDRTRLTGVRTGADADADGDDLAATMAEANGFAAVTQDVHDYTFTMGEGYAMVGEPGDDGIPVVTAEDPRQTVGQPDPARPWRCQAGLKLYVDEWTGDDLVKVLLPGQVWTARKVRHPGRSRRSGWVWDNSAPALLPPGFEQVVPLVRFPNRLGMGEFETHLDLLDRINHTILQRLVITAMQAFKQRALKGDLPDRDPETGETIDYDALFESDPGALWRLPEGVDLWESGQVDLTGVLTGVRDDVKELAAVTRTPLHYITPDAANGSAEGATTMREGHVFKVEDRRDRLTPPWLDVYRLMFRYIGDSERAEGRLSAIWGPVERHSLAERADAAAKARDDLPWRSRLVDIWQVPPGEIARYESERASDRLLDAALLQGAAAQQQAAAGPQGGA